MADTLFDLPDEVLQLIGESVPLDPTILRLVCRRFDAAFLDLFAKRLLNDVHCFVLDPQRLSRLDAITSQEHLLCRIKKVTITLSPHEGKWIDDYPSVATGGDPDDSELSDAQYKFATVMEYTSYGQWLKSPQLDLSVLADILERLKTAPCPYIALSLVNGEDPVDKRLPGKRSPIIADSTLAMIFHAVLASGCTISKLDLSDTRFLDIRTCPEAQWLKTLRESGHGLRALSLRPQADDIGRIEERNKEHRGVFSACRPLINIIYGAKSLQSLSISATYCPARKFDGFKQEREYRYFACLMDALLDSGAYQFEQLESLNLFGVECEFDILLQILQRNQKTLQTIDLTGVCLHGSEADAWLKIFKHMRSECRNLSHLSLESLQEETQLVVDMSDEHLSFADLLALEHSKAFYDEEKEKELKLIGRDEVERGLDENIKIGLHFIRY